VLHCNTEDDCVELLKLLPPTEAALLDWAINLMADVVEHEQFNKMNARNIAMVFAPNMTQV
jgi:translation initiation factor IF-3